MTIQYHTLGRPVTMEPVNLADTGAIWDFLGKIALRGKGVTTENLMEFVLDEGFTEPTYLNAKGEDPDAFYLGQPYAWGIYQVREWKRVLIISGGGGKERRMQITETP
jgi:hypothetical protein